MPESREVALMPGKPFGPYTIVNQLDRGGMGAVFLARYTTLEREVVLNVWRTAKAEVRACFERETSILAQLVHPNVVRVYDWGTLKGLDYLASEYVRGETLTDRLRRLGPLPIPEAVQVVRRLALAMEAVHQAGILHRDLKASHILMKDNGEPILIGFSLARLLDDASDSRIVGPPSYMAPELLQNLPSIGPPADIYALGVLLYELWTGQVPFTGHPSVVIGQHLFAQPRSPSELGRDLPRQLESVCLKALAKRPEDRFASMTAFAHALVQFATVRPNAPMALLDEEATGCFEAPSLIPSAPPPPTEPRNRRHASFSAAGTDRPGPTLIGRNVGSNSGSSTCFIMVETTRSRSVRMPRRRVAPGFPSLGTSSQRGAACVRRSRSSASRLSQSAACRPTAAAVSPSTPGVAVGASHLIAGSLDAAPIEQPGHEMRKRQVLVE